MIHHSDDWLTIHQGDAATVLATLPADSVDCIVTSPPYFGLRDYGTATWIGGDEGCDHTPAATGSTQNKGNNGKMAQPWAYYCRKCGATRQDSQLGLEATPEEYVANLVAVFRELRRVLKPSGTCWLNLGDSYAGSGRGGNPADSEWKGYVGNADRERAAMPHLQSKQVEAGAIGRNWVAPPAGLKQKDLVGIPWRVAFALQADGWWLRSDIIWSKPNPMPESVTDRPTKAHEYLFLLTKSARYYYDADAVREPHIVAHLSRYSYDFWPEGTKEAGGNGRPDLASNTGGSKEPNPLGRNLRSVWTIATRPYPGAHFAVFPPELPERCIKAGSPEGGVVLDPFAGSGTVGLVANRLSRRAILIDLNADYLKQQMQRNAQTPLGLGA